MVLARLNAKGVQVANIKQVEQSTPLSLPQENDTTPPESAASTPLRTLDPALLRQFVQLLSQQQGQLPPEQAQKLQPLLRQLTPLLDPSNPEPAEPTITNTASTATAVPAAPLQQLLQRILPLLPGSDPLLRQTLSYGERGNIPLAQLQQQPQLLQELLTRLPPMLQENAAPGRALNQWLLQLVTLRTPTLTPQSSGHQSLKSQLLQSQIALPSEALLNDKRGQAQLQSLTKETLQLLARASLPITNTPEPAHDNRTTSDSAMPGDKRSSAAIPLPQPKASEASTLFEEGKATGQTTTSRELKEKLGATLARITPSWLSSKLTAPPLTTTASTSATQAVQSPSPTTTTTPTTGVTMPSGSTDMALATEGAEDIQHNGESVPSRQQADQPKLTSGGGATIQMGRLPQTQPPHSLPIEPVGHFDATAQPTGSVIAKLASAAEPNARLSPAQTAELNQQQTVTLTNQPIGERPQVVVAQPLGEFIHQLNQQVSHAASPSPLRPLLLQLSTLLQQPLTSEGAVREWIQFLRSPMSETTSMGRAMRQWGLTLLAIRFGVQGKLNEAQQQHLSQQLGQSLQDLLGAETQQALGKMTGHFLGQVDRLQQQAEPQQPLPNYIPLPPLHPDGREGSLGWQRSPGKHNAYQWSINFYLEPAGLGPVQVRACLDIPDLQLQVTAEKLTTVDRIKQTLPQLESRFRELGLTPTAMGCRQGKIPPPPQAATTNGSDGLSIHI